MKRILIFLVLTLFGAQMIFAQETVADVPESLRNNVFFRESMRQTNLARLAFLEGDYVASTHFSQRALHYANLSDEFVTDNIIATAGWRLNRAVATNASVRHPEEFSKAETAYAEAHYYRVEESWKEAIGAANRVLAALALMHVTAEAPGADGLFPLPAQYTVRPWVTYGDSLWNIAGRIWAYNDPHRWRLLFEANRSRMPDPNNPDLIHPGMVLDIPSIRGEHRQGMWHPDRRYVPLP